MLLPELVVWLEPYTKGLTSNLPTLPRSPRTPLPVLGELVERLALV